MKLGASLGLAGRLLAIVLLVALVDFGANTLVFQRASRFALDQDDAARLAERLVSAERVLEHTAPANRPSVARELSTGWVELRWAAKPGAAGDTPAQSLEMNRLRAQVERLQPELVPARLRFHLLPLKYGGDIGGSLILSDRSVVSFIRHGKATWTLNLGQLAGLLMPTLVLIGLAWVLLRTTLQPLRRLLRATLRVGAGEPAPLPEEGPGELRQLIRAFNAMQQRIHGLIASRTQSLLAIGHDLRTPLARLQLRLDNAGLPPETYREMAGDIAEMRDLLHSLQAFTQSGETTEAPQRLDLAAMIETLVDNATDLGREVAYHGPDSLVIRGRPVNLRRAIANLIDNAVHYGGRADVRLARDEKGITLAVEDDGPGIPPDKLAEVLHPFVRLDNARRRDTPGMGLGLAIVSRAVRAEGGTLGLANRAEGGLRASLHLPAAALG